MNVEDIPFDEKMKVIRDYLCDFWIFDMPNGLLEARLDHDYFTEFMGNCVYINELIDLVYEYLHDTLGEWCGCEW